MSNDSSGRSSLLSSLQGAIMNNQMDFVIQPKFDAALSIVGAEVLARWNSEVHGEISPVVFVPLAEANGLSAQLGNLAIRYAAHCIAVLADSGHTIPISVNVSASEFMSGDLLNNLISVCDEFGVPPSQLELEMTESIFLHNTKFVVRNLGLLESAGFNIALDDFGSGYSALAYLKKFNFKTIKIDRLFLSEFGCDHRTEVLLTWVIGLCKSLGASIVVEGVEFNSQLIFLQKKEVDMFQGFLLSPPVALDALLMDARLGSSIVKGNVR